MILWYAVYTQPHGETKALDRRLSEVADPDLRAALAQLGRAVNGAQR